MRAAAARAAFVAGWDAWCSAIEIDGVCRASVQQRVIVNQWLCADWRAGWELARALHDVGGRAPRVGEGEEFADFEVTT